MDNLEIATAPNSWMACKSNNCGAVSPAVLLNWREYRSVARMICLIVMRTSISWLRRIAPKYGPKWASGYAKTAFNVRKQSVLRTCIAITARLDHGTRLG